MVFLGLVIGNLGNMGWRNEDIFCQESKHEYDLSSMLEGYNMEMEMGNFWEKKKNRIGTSLFLL